MPVYQGRGLGVTIQDRIGRDSYSELANSEHGGDSRQRELHVAKRRAIRVLYAGVESYFIPRKVPKMVRLDLGGTR
jgi:hypothetical protein